jgi:hypothetical protein
MAASWPLMSHAEELGFIGEALDDGEHKGVVVAGRAGVV